MNRESRAERRAKDNRRAKTFAIVAVVVVAALVGRIMDTEGRGSRPPGVSEKTGPGREVVVLLDTSDPLSDKHKAELRRILREMTSPAASGRHDALAVKKGERVTLYRLESTGVPERPITQICHPGGNPEEKRRQFEELTKGTVITEWRWEQFVRVIEAMFPSEEHEAQPLSPNPGNHRGYHRRHASSRRAESGAKPTHLVVISDLLQTPGCFHTTRQYLTPKRFLANSEQIFRESRLACFDSKRHKYEVYQTPEHYYWWTDWVEAMGGKVVWQQAL